MGRGPTDRERRDAFLTAEIHRVHRENYGVYGARKIWLQLNRENIPVARCTVERLMRDEGLTGAVRGKVKRTTIADPAAKWPHDLVRREFAPLAPDRLWVGRFHVRVDVVGLGGGTALHEVLGGDVAFVIDDYARRILGWSASTSMAADFVLHALEQAVWTRNRYGPADFSGLINHHDKGSQGGFNRSSQHSDLRSDDGTTSGQVLVEAGIADSVGSTRDSYDNALAETINRLYKTELIKPGKPWKTVAEVEVEIATAEWVDWFNHRRLYECCGDIPPAELEAAYYARTATPQLVESSV